MANFTAQKQYRQDSKKLAIHAYRFLLNQMYYEKKLSTKAQDHINTAINNLEKVYKIGIFNYAYELSKERKSLEDIFAIGRYHVPVKMRIAAESHKKKGNSFMDEKMFKNAEMEYTMAVQKDPSNAIYFCNRAASRTRQGLFTDAVVDCKVALDLDKLYTKAHCLLGLVYALMDQPAQAIRCYRKALRIEPQNPVCKENMNLICKNMNHKVFRVFEPVFRFSPCFFQFAANLANKQTSRRQNGDNNGEETSENMNIRQFDEFKLEKLD